MYKRIINSILHLHFQKIRITFEKQNLLVFQANFLNHLLTLSRHGLLSWAYINPKDYTKTIFLADYESEAKFDDNYSHIVTIGHKKYHKIYLVYVQVLYINRCRNSKNSKNLGNITSIIFALTIVKKTFTPFETLS